MCLKGILRDIQRYPQVFFITLLKKIATELEEEEENKQLPRLEKIRKILSRYLEEIPRNVKFKYFLNEERI